MSDLLGHECSESLLTICLEHPHYPYHECGRCLSSAGSSNAWKDNSPVPTPSVSIIEGSVSTLLDENGREGKSRDGVPLSAVEDAFDRKERAGVMFALSTTPPPIAPLRYFYTLTDYGTCLTDLLVPRRAYSHSAAQGQFHGAFATARAVATLLTTVATCQQMNLPLETLLIQFAAILIHPQVPIVLHCRVVCYANAQTQGRYYQSYLPYLSICNSNPLCLVYLYLLLRS